VMPFGITLLILFFICHNFGRLERVNPFYPKNVTSWGGDGKG
jgi:hypothetical protein